MELVWRKAIRSSEQGDAFLEIARRPNSVAFRDRKDLDGLMGVVSRRDLGRLAPVFKDL